MAKDWKSSLCVGTPKFEVHKVGGVDQKFYAIRGSTAFKLRDIIKPMAAVLTTFFGAMVGREYSTVQRSLHAPGSTAQAPMMDSETTLKAIDKDTIAMLLESRVKAIQDMVDALSLEENQAIIAELIMDSMRDVFPSVNDRPPALEFYQQAEVPEILDMIVGVVKGNKRVFGPLAQRTEAALDRALSSFMAKVALPSNENSNGQSESNHGKNSKTESTGSPSEATTTNGS